MSSNTVPNHRIMNSKRHRGRSATPTKAKQQVETPQPGTAPVPRVRLPTVSPPARAPVPAMAWNTPVDEATETFRRLLLAPVVKLPGSPAPSTPTPKGKGKAVADTVSVGSSRSSSPSRAPLSIPSPSEIEFRLKAFKSTPDGTETPAPRDEAAVENTTTTSAADEAEDASSANGEEKDEIVETEDDKARKMAARVFDGQSHSCIIMKADGTGPLDGYHPTRVYRLGKSTADGLTTRVIMQIGAFGPKSVEIHFSRQSNQRSIELGHVDADFSGASLDYHRFDSSSEEGQNTLRILDVVRFGANTPAVPKDLVKTWVPPEDKDFLNSEAVSNFESQFAVVNFTLPKAGISINKLVKPESSSPEVVKMIDDALAPYQNIPRERSGVAVSMIMAADEHWASELNLAFDAGEHVDGSLVAAFCSRVKKLEQLDAKNVNILEDVPIPPRSMAARDNFHNNTQRTAILTAGVAQEEHYLELRSLVCDNVASFAALIPVDGTQWLAATDDEKVYGVKSNGQYQNFVVVVRSPEGTSNFLPDVKQDVSLSLRLDYRFRTIPKLVLEDQDIEKAVRVFLVSFQTIIAKAKLRLEEKKALHRRRFLNDKRRTKGNSRDADGAALSDEEDEDDGDYVPMTDQEIEEAYLEMALPKLAKLLLPYIPFKLTDEQKGDLKLDDARRAVAKQDMAGIHTRLDENPTTVTRRVREWFNSHREVHAHTEEVTWADIRWHGRRIAQPTAVVSGYQFYYVQTPRHPNWPVNCKAPPLEFVYDHPGNEGNAQALHDRLNMAIPTRVFYEENTDILKFEGKALYTLNNLAHGSNGYQWFIFAINFNPDLAEGHKVDWFARFPALADFVASGAFKGEHAIAVACLRETNFGKFILLGGPGSGKSTFADLLVKAVLAMPTLIGDEQRRPAIIYTLGMNTLVDDSERRFVALNPGRRSVRLFPWKRELKAILYEPTESANMPRATGERHVCSTAIRQHCRSQLGENDEDTSPHKHSRSLASLCRARIAADPERYGRIISGWQKYKDDRPAFDDEKVGLKVTITDLMKSVMKDMDAVFCTPHCVRDLRDNCPDFAPTFMVIDEAGFLTETAAMVPVAAYPEVDTLFCGDPNQFQPIVASHRAGFTYKFDEDCAFEFHDLVSEQRRRPLLARVQGLQRADFTLVHNHRVFGNAGFYMMYNLFDGNMVMANDDIKNSAVLSVHSWMSREFKATENSYWFELSDGEEVQVGTSYVLEAQGYFALEFAIKMAKECNFPHMGDWVACRDGALPADRIRRGRICIGTMYAQQREWIRARLDEIPGHEIDQSRIDVRTIDQCLSHQAEVFILVVGRSARSGHTKEIHRTNVALTRHTLLSITVSSTKLVRVLPPNLAQYRQYHEQQNLLETDIKGWDRWCTKCCSHGHEIANCPGAPDCNICKGKHAARNCKRVPKSKILADEMWTESTKDTESKSEDASASIPLVPLDENGNPIEGAAFVDLPDDLKEAEKKSRPQGQDSHHRSLIQKTSAGQKEKKPKGKAHPTTKQRNEARRTLLAKDSKKAPPKPEETVVINTRTERPKRPKPEENDEPEDNGEPTGANADEDGWDNPGGTSASANDNKWTPDGESEFHVTGDVLEEDRKARQLLAPRHEVFPGETCGSGSGSKEW
ncbi:hypothetical protein PWT90_03750 [Aphanocladium album]|nr:hypothetical protein PWT90_03750 [Aphanocladium album]